MEWYEECMAPIWTGDAVFEESVMFIGGKDGGTEQASLIYRPEKILKVCSPDRKTVYQEGRDYIVRDGRLERPAGSGIPAWSYGEYYLSEKPELAIKSIMEDGKYLRFDGGDAYSAHQAMVTYRHRDSWQGAVPCWQGDILSGTVTRLREGKPMRIVYYGDSIMAGYDASSLWDMEPFMPQLSDLVTMRLKSAWNHEHIEGINTAVGGTDSIWGLGEIRERVCAHRPDLVVIGFGMNDGHCNPPLRYEAMVRQMIAMVREASPDAEFLLVSTMMPNPDGFGWTCWQPMYQWNLKKIAAELPGVAVAPMTDVSAYILSRKKFEDVTGNGINHPNDFLVRVYAQVISASLVK